MTKIQNIQNLAICHPDSPMKLGSSGFSERGELTIRVVTHITEDSEPPPTDAGGDQNDVCVRVS